MIEAMGSIMLPEVKKSLMEHALPGLAKQVKIVPAKLGDLAAVMGAAKIAEGR